MTRRRLGRVAGRIVTDQFSTQVRASDGFVRIAVAGEVTRPRLMALGARIEAECLRHALPRVLVDIRRVTGDVPTADKFEIGERAARDFTGKISLALLADPATLDPFFDTVAGNRGLDVRLFTDEAEASAWLATRPPAVA